MESWVALHSTIMFLAFSDKTSTLSAGFFSSSSDSDSTRTAASPACSELPSAAVAATSTCKLSFAFAPNTLALHFSLLATLCSFLKQSLHCLQLQATILHFQAQACCMIPAYSLHRSAAIGKLHSCFKSHCRPRLHRALLAPRILHTCRHAAAGKTWVCIQHHRLFLPISLQVDLASAASALLHVCSML